ELWDVHDGIVGVPLDPARWTFCASQITALGQCAFKWFAQRRLRLGELEEAEEEVSPLVRGSIYHRTLEIALSRARDAEDVRAAALENLEAAFAEAEAGEGIPRQASWPMRRQHHLEVLRRVLRAEDFFTPEGEIVSLEESFEGTWRGLRVRGIVDRVDLGLDGLVLLDYKTRANMPVGAKSSSGKADLDVQLPLYVETAAQALHPGEPVAGARYYSLTKAKVIAEATINEGELTALVERVQGHLEAGAYPVDPDLKQDACGYCDFDLVCRMGPRIERKRQGGDEG
ncbi:MAG: PD-(D/E)XK nuclease family protein, partial [Acidobacteriota bacterium]